jgi:hypothetical protein
MANTSELTESELYEKGRVDVTSIDITDTATYPSGEEHPRRRRNGGSTLVRRYFDKNRPARKDRRARHFTQSGKSA